MTTLLRHRTWHLVPILYSFVSQITSEKMRYRPSWLIDIHHSLGWPIIPFHYENSVAVLIYPVRNHLAVGTRVRRTALGNIGFGIKRKPIRKTCAVIPKTSSSSLTNHSFSLWKWYFGLDIPSKKSSRFRNACRAYDWWHHHLISSSRFQYPNNFQKKTSKAHTK